MTWIYRLQQHAALTRLELQTVATLALLFAGGLAARTWLPAEGPALSPALLAAETAAFRAAAAVPDTALAARRDSVVLAAADALHAEAVAAAAPAAPGADSLAASATVEEGYARRAKKLPFTGRMDLNAASEAQLQLLPRVGPKLAERIAEYRRAHGRFRSVDELNAVKGIGDKTLAKLAPHLYVR